jgi:hypothetical protein
VCRQSDDKDFKKKQKELERRTNDKGKEFLKGYEKERWALPYDKDDKHCWYMTCNMRKNLIVS